MSRLASAALLIVMLSLGCPPSPAGNVGRKIPAERTTWTDPEFGCEITQWTNAAAPSWHLYFNIESFVDSTHAIIYSRRSGKLDLYLLDLGTGIMTQMTDEEDLTTEVWHLPARHTLWFTAGRELKALDTRTFAVKDVAQLPHNVTSFSVTCDGRFAVLAGDRSLERAGSGSATVGPYALFRLDLSSHELVQISPDYGFIIGHVLASPTDPARVTYCWQHQYRETDTRGTMGGTPLRIWWISVDGTRGGPLLQEFGIHRTHEFWFPDGSRMGYSARYLFGPDKGKQFLGSCRPDGSDNFMIPAPVSSSHSMIFSDGKHWVADLYDGPVLAMLTLEDRAVVHEQKLFRHNSTMNGQPSHPHPHFSPDGKYVLFSTDRTGTPQVYTVRVDLRR